MPRSGSGSYSLPAVYLATPGTTIESDQHNVPLQDIAQALTDSLPRNGSAPMTGNLPMGGNRITGLATPTANGDATTKAYVDGRTGAPVAGDIQYAAPGLAGRSDAGAGTGRVVFLGAGVEFLDGTLRATLGAGLSFVAGAITAVISRFATQPEAVAGTNTDAAMNPLRTAQAINANLAGTVLSGGAGMVSTIGNLTASRTIAMGTPSSITATSTNSTTATSHTHALPASQVRELIANGSEGLLGTYAFLTMPGNGAIRAAGFTTAGSNLEYANADGGGNGSPGGTWMLMGTIGTATQTQRTSLWLRVT